MEKFVVLFVALATFVSVNGLMCWVCENQPSNEACQRSGTLQRCQSNEQACQNEVRRIDRGILITKRCKQALACDNNFIQNPRDASIQSQCNIRLPSSVCRCCCDTDMCNAPELGCLQRDPPPADCQPFQTAPLNGEVECTEENRDGSVCEFTCNRRYFLRGSDQTTCNGRDRRWDRLPPTCDPIRCNPRHVNPANGIVSCSDRNNLDSVCRFTCNPGYFAEGPTESTCTDDLDNDGEGVWTNQAPTCTRIRCNPPHTSPENGAVDCSDENNEGSICSFSCDENFALSGSETSTCEDDFDGDGLGLWSTLPPTCEIGACGEPPAAPENGFRVCPNGNVLGSRCEYGCNDYHSRVGPLYVNCIESDGALVWDSPPPICQPNTCPAQVLPRGEVICDREERVDDTFLASSTCMFMCTEPDYALYPPNATENTCLNSSDWNIPRPCCSRPCPPFALMDLVVQMDSSSSVGDDNWVIMTQFVRNFIDSFRITPTSVNVGVFRYNREVDTATQILLTDYPNNQTGLLEAFDRIPYDGSGTATGNGLQHVIDVLFTAGNGNRPGVRDVLVVVTDGRSQDEVALPAQQLRDEGVLIFVVGIIPPRGRLDRGQLDDIAGDPNQVFVAEGGFEALEEEVLSRLTSEVCGEPCDEDPLL